MGSELWQGGSPCHADPSSDFQATWIKIRIAIRTRTKEAVSRNGKREEWGKEETALERNHKEDTPKAAI
jgi:hypothetical protein